MPQLLEQMQLLIQHVHNKKSGLPICVGQCKDELRDISIGFKWLQAKLDSMCPQTQSTENVTDLTEVQTQEPETTTIIPTPAVTTQTSSIPAINQPGQDIIVRDFSHILRSDKAPCTTYFVSSKRMTWLDARNFCQRRNLELATIYNSIENYVLQYNTDRPWIGGLRTEAAPDSQKFLWNNGLGVNCANWKVNEPDNMYQNEYCLRIDTEGYWCDWYCGDESMQVICENRTCYPECDLK